MNDSNNAQTRMDSDPPVRIPGIADLVGKSGIPSSLLLLTGPAGVGKSMYCRQFFLDSIIQEGCYCIYVSANMPDKQFKSILSRREHPELIHNSKFINPYLNTSDNADPDKLSSVLVQVHDLLTKQKESELVFLLFGQQFLNLCQHRRQFVRIGIVAAEIGVYEFGIMN